MIGAPTPAKLTPKTDARGRRRNGTELPVHFNPESLQITIRNTMEEAKHDTSNGRPSQLVASSEVALAVQLVFDTTRDGSDVRAVTSQVAEMMRPGSTVAREDGKRRPMVVEFSWADFAFEGIITDYSETIDYFAENGVPLRSSLNLTVTRHEAAFPQAGSSSADTGQGTAPPTAPVASGDSLKDSVDRSGAAGPGGASPAAVEDVAAANGVENLKEPEASELASPSAAFSAGAAAGAMGSPLSAGAGVGAAAGVSAGAGVQFGAAPAAFASGDAGFGLDLGAGAGLSAGAGAGLSAGASLGGGASASLGGGAGLSVGSASGGGLELDAFAELKPPKLSVSAGAKLGGGIDFDLPDAPGIGGGLSAGAGVSLGGAAGLSAGIGAGAGIGGVGGGQTFDVGREINLADILFKEDG